MPGEPSLSELPLDMRWGTILFRRGDPGPTVGRCAGPRAWCRGEGVGEVVVTNGWPSGVETPPRAPGLLGVRLIAGEARA